MNHLLRILPVFLLLFLSIQLQAQSGPGGGGPGGGRMDPTERAEKQTQMMIDSLGLSTAQGEKVREINKKYAEKNREIFQAARENGGGDREAMRNAMQTQRKAQDEELKAILTEDQWAEWQLIRASRPAGPGREKPRN
jgi:periplasmic protein CpxP/Spy